MDAHRRGDLPVTIAKPSTTYGPASGLLRQIAFDFTWIDRVRRGMPIAICGDGDALHQFMHADDCGQAIARLVGQDACLGETYNIVPDRCWTWREHHEIAMEAIGAHVDLVPIPYDKLARADIPGFQICKDIFRHHSYFSADKLNRDVPAFSQRYSLPEGMRATLEKGKIASADDNTWEDPLIDAFG
jgi:nucleoside-diphosphate-sugar epimerase